MSKFDANFSDIFGILSKKLGGCLTPKGKITKPAHFVFQSYWVVPSTWQSFIENGEMACITSDWSSRKFALKCTQYTMCMNNLFHKKCLATFLKMTAKSKLFLTHPKMEQLVEIPFIVFHLARLIFTGQTSHLDMTYPKHSSFFRTFYLSIDLYSRTVMAL